MRRKKTEENILYAGGGSHRRKARILHDCGSSLYIFIPIYYIAYLCLSLQVIVKIINSGHSDRK